MPSLILMTGSAPYLCFALRRAGLAASLVLVGMTTSAHAQSQTAAAPVVLELFTSQGCNSCPPADALMQDWLRQPDIIPISLHVDYWDYLGWKDTLSKKGHGIRQQDYARNSGKREVYTPQVVVNGKYVVVGSDRKAVEKALEKARRMPSVAIAAERNNTTGNWQITVPAVAGFEGEAKLVLCRYDTQHEVAIERGENSGKTLNYLNVARSWGDLGRWKGQSASYDLPDLTGTDWGRQGAMVMLQIVTSEGVGPVLGAVDIKDRDIKGSK
ncbi:thioredoxin family protein [Ferrovibrio sp.]|uniref:DUF1223 domain-containing protein n=1 Tax=Ferrovibrio sp. TaxID=1917215 RepID=UPI000CC297E8|nr:DUF1223 domain-containing protein [Ferrovibrio sp.]PJI42013.1 MAG: DUF1223 domain-containing protein [Ferrovibrio sp.]